MTHTYVTLDALKGASALNITGTANDDRLLGLAEAASSVVDRWCNRHFYARKAALRFDGSGEATLGVPDLVSVDDGGVRIYANGYSSSNGAATIWGSYAYSLLPFNAGAASASSPNSRPYTRLLAVGGANGSGRFPLGRGNVEVRGVWGWCQRLRRASQVVGTAASGDAGTLHVSEAAQGTSAISAGHTLLIGDEQVYVRARDSGKLTVERGVNGTTADAIANGSAIDIYEYPAAVSEAALLLAVRMWRSARGGVDDWQAGEMGIDPDIGMLLSMYRKPALGVF